MIRFVALLFALTSASTAFGQAGLDGPGLLTPGDVDSPFGWPLTPDATGSWKTVTVNGVAKTLAISDMFPNGLALGRAATNWPYIDDGTTRRAGPALDIYASGLATIGGTLPQTRHDQDGTEPGLPSANEDGSVGISRFKDSALTSMADAPELLAARWSEVADYGPNGEKPCQDAAHAPDHQVYFWSSRFADENAPGTPYAVITWHEMAARGNCALAPNTFQLVIIQLPERAPDSKGNLAQGRNLAQLQYRFAACNWAAPVVVDGAVGARTGFLVRASVYDDNNVEVEIEQQAVEVLGVAGQLEDHISGPAFANPLSDGYSGDPNRAAPYCDRSNQEDAALKGVFVFDFGGNGLPMADADLDGVADGVDNCAGRYNPLQGNVDRHLDDVRGDACDLDMDNDTRMNDTDNCPRHFNRDQADADGDLVGDACDADRDGDGVSNVVGEAPWHRLHDEDNCWTIANPDQLDFDGDGTGDACEPKQENQDVADGTLEWFVRAVLKSLTVRRNELTQNVSQVRAALEGNSEFNAMNTLSMAEVEGIIRALLQEWESTTASFLEFLQWREEDRLYLLEKYLP